MFFVYSRFKKWIRSFSVYSCFAEINYWQASLQIWFLIYLQPTGASDQIHVNVCKFTLSSPSVQIHSHIFSTNITKQQWVLSCRFTLLLFKWPLSSTRHIFTPLACIPCVGSRIWFCCPIWTSKRPKITSDTCMVWCGASCKICDANQIPQAHA